MSKKTSREPVAGAATGYGFPDAKAYHVLSLGAGVQSSTLALMAARGEISPMPDFAVFADTYAEPKAVYDWLDWLETQLPFPVYRVAAKTTIEQDALKLTRSVRDGGKRMLVGKSLVPWYTLTANGDGKGTLLRSCTVDKKIVPLLREVRDRAGVKRGQKTPSVTQWIGISWDEIQRMKESREPWCMHRWPLIERRMTRADCKKWMRDNGYPEPPRSACVFCPFHHDSEWLRLKQDAPGEFKKAVEFERAFQDVAAKSDNLRDTPYLHASRVPLDQVEFKGENETQLAIKWGDECEGMCGL